MLARDDEEGDSLFSKREVLEQRLGELIDTRDKDYLNALGTLHALLHKARHDDTLEA